jgi:DNA-binding NtrC family response regulator
LSAPLHKKVLIIEEDDDIRLALGDILASEGHTVCAVKSGLEGLDRLRAMQPVGIVMLDLLKNGMTSEEFIAAKNVEATSANVPVVLVSASRRLPEIAKTLGVAAYLAKPMKMQELLDIVTRYAK